ncbi:MAG: bifunctional diaminohydroxyphosphoribosylaminopyrimidine deaminase/5-amino-6-(5-phosphoribosylamino)uracil reductase RibD [Gammaproteobacteria bacterium]
MNNPSPAARDTARFSEFDRLAMARALALAARGLETTHPNPRVGCVVAREHRILAEGWHAFAGEPHAEVLALRAAGDGARGATAYVTLEPCSHHGRTPPCVDALVAARVSRVVFAMHDPHPRVDGKGAAALRSAGMSVDSGLMEADALELNAGFVIRIRHGRPWVRLKLGASLDGRTALANGESRWITGEAARNDVQRWRARSSAVLTGIGTALADDPRLDVRVPADVRRQPLRVVLDSQLRLPPDARVLEPPGEALVLTSSDDEARRNALVARGARLERIAVDRLDLNEVVRVLARLEVNELLVEAGPTLTGAFIAADLVDELIVYLAPTFLGPQARPLALLPELVRLQDRRRFEIVETELIGADLRLRLRPCAADGRT